MAANILQYCRRIYHEISSCTPFERGSVKKVDTGQQVQKRSTFRSLSRPVSWLFVCSLVCVCYNCYPLGCLSMPHAGGKATCATPWISWYAYTYLKIKIKMALVENVARQYGQRSTMVTRSFGCLVASTPPW